MSAPCAKGSKFDPRIKPPQWGPLSHVQSAVRYNCDRLGLPPILSGSFFWEDGGRPKEQMQGLSLSFVGGEWKKDGYGIYNEGDYIEYPGDLFSTTENFTLFWDLEVGVSPNEHAVLCFFGSDDRESNRATLYATTTFGAATNEMRFWTNREGEIFVGPDIRGTSVKVALVKEGDTYSLFINGELNASGTYSGPVHGQNFRLGVDRTSNNRPLYGTVRSFYVLQYALDADQHATLAEQPYALLMPVARPVYFDLAATPGPATPTNLQGTPSTDSILWTWEAGS